MSVSIHRLRRPRRANEALDGSLTDAEQIAMIAAAESKLQDLFEILQVDYRNDHNTRGTPAPGLKGHFVQECIGLERTS